MGDSPIIQPPVHIGGAKSEWQFQHTEMYLSSGGVRGHIIDGTDYGTHRFITTLLLKYVGRKSGKPYVTPLIYGDIGGEVVVVASAGRDQHPAWYLNVREMDTVEFQIATQAFRASWREPTGAEREKIWRFMMDVFPPYTTLQGATTRNLPLVVMKADKAVERFTG